MNKYNIIRIYTNNFGTENRRNIWKDVYFIEYNNIIKKIVTNGKGGVLYFRSLTDATDYINIKLNN